MYALLISLVLTSSLDREQFAKVMRSATPGFKRCYETALKEDPRLRGRVVFELDIAADGTVTTVKLTLPEENPAFELCLTRRARTLRFGKGSAPIKVTWPLQLVPGP